MTGKTGKTATYVLVHGGGHGGWCYRKVARGLRAMGHEVHAPTLTGLGERAHLLGPEIDLDSQIDDILQVLRFEGLRDVILVGHSYGGMVITGVADRAADRVGHVVYLDAANPENGQSLEDIAGPMMALARQAGRTEGGVELVLWPFPEAGRFYGVTDPDDLAWMDDKLTPHPWKCFAQKLVLTGAGATIPQSHIVCSSTLPGRDVEALKARAEGRFWEIDTGHDLMITEPEKVVDLLDRVASL
jgi:pimeloyl-ACP methyl ester carboxylesterase